MENREIKFRAWDRFKKVMFKVYNLKGDSATGELCSLDLGIKKTPCSIQNVILMQYTGLKDKDGKEIYEGDVIAVIVEQIEFKDTEGKTWFTTFHKDGKYAKIIKRQKKELHRVVIKWLNGSTTSSGGYNSEHHGGYHISFPYTAWYRIDQYEIIGNIYSNPELIEK